MSLAKERCDWVSRMLLASIPAKLEFLTAGFGPRLSPQPLVGGSNIDCKEVGNLTYHILTRNGSIGGSGVSPTPPGKILVRTQSVNIEVDIDHQLGGDFFDFLECCNRKEINITALLRVSMCSNHSDQLWLTRFSIGSLLKGAFPMV